LNGPIVVNMFGIAAVGAWIFAQAFPSTRAVRVRNALLARRAMVADFEWKPANAPSAFWQENRPAPPAFADAVTRIELGSCTGDWNRALRLAEHLANYARDLGPIRADLETTYARIRDGYGYCADFVKVFLGLAHAAGICARQWAFSFDGFGGHGHTVVEIFDRERDKWLFLDIYNNFHVRDAATQEPLGALEFRDALLRENREFRLVPNGSGRAGFPLEHKLLAYYRRGLQEWYLICGNAVFSYEAWSLVRWSSRISGAMGQVVATFLGVHPSIQVLGTRENEAAVQALRALGRRFRVALVVFGILILVLVVQLSFYGMAPVKGAA
jgi:hypothetical protein